MIPISEIDGKAREYKVSSSTIEKDYITSWVLLSLSQSNLMNDFIFYGGTAIKRVFFETHRFSEDIDLTSSKIFNIDYILKQLDCLNYAKEIANISVEINPDQITNLNDRTRNEPRDLYDIWFLLHRIDQFDFSVNTVLSSYKEKYGYKPSTNTLISSIPRKSLKNTWANRLETQVATLPNYDLVIQEIELMINKLFKPEYNH